MSIPALFLTASVSMMSDPAAIIDKLFDAFNRHDVAALQFKHMPWRFELDQVPATIGPDADDCTPATLR